MKTVLMRSDWTIIQLKGPQKENIKKLSFPTDVIGVFFQ